MYFPARVTSRREMYIAGIFKEKKRIESPGPCVCVFFFFLPAPRATTPPSRSKEGIH